MTRARRGSVLIVVYFVVAGLLGLVVPQTMRAMSSLQVETRYVSNTQALQLAEAGLDQALKQLDQGPVPGCDPSMSELPIAGDFGTAGEYSGKIVRHACGAVTPPLDRFYTVTMTGSSAATDLTLQAKVARDPIPSPFQQSAYGTVESSYYTGVNVSWFALVDSYDSAQGDYGGTNVGDEAELRTNSTRPVESGNAAVQVVSYGALHGDARAPVGAGIYEDNPANITGTLSYDQGITTFPVATPPTEPEPSSCPDLGTVVAVGSAVYDGTCYRAASITANGAGVMLDFPNLETLYVTGDTTITNGAAVRVGQGTVRTRNMFVNQANSAFLGQAGQVDLYLGGVHVDYGGLMAGAGYLPKNLRLYQANAIGGNNQVFVRWGSDVYGTVYAPEYPVYLSVHSDNSAIYGAVICYQCIFSSTGMLHYDVSLESVTEGWPRWVSTAPRIVTMKAWRRCNTLQCP